MARPIRIEIFPGREHVGRGLLDWDRFYFRFRAGNGEILAVAAKPEGYATKANAKRAARKLAADLRAASFVVLDHVE